MSRWAVGFTQVLFDGASASGFVCLANGERWEGEEQYARRYALALQQRHVEITFLAQQVSP